MISSSANVEDSLSFSAVRWRTRSSAAAVGGRAVPGTRGGQLDERPPRRAPGGTVVLRRRAALAGTE